MKWVTIIWVVLCLWGCGKNDPPQAPGTASLLFPERNSECTTGQSLSTTASRVEFRWQASDNTESYELRVTNLNTNTTQTAFVQTTTASVTLEKGVPYSWAVVSKNTQTTTAATSEQWFFYNAGSQTSFAPFPAEIIAPKSATNIFKDGNNEVELTWTATDLDGDIVGYEVYFSVETPPRTLIASPTADETQLRVDVSSNTVYYWKVITRDAVGNTSDSGVFDFKVF